MGIELPTALMYQTLNSSPAATFPFFFIGFRRQVASLVRDEKDEPKSNQLSLLRQNIARRHIDRGTSKESQMPNLWQPEKLERRFKKYRQRKNSALLLQRLRYSILEACAIKFSSFFFPTEVS